MRVLRGVVYMTKSSGPRTEPWGTPQEEVCQEDRDKWRKCVHGVANPRIEDG